MSFRYMHMYAEDGPYVMGDYEIIAVWILYASVLMLKDEF